ncbi:hypothetical protein SOVF_060610 [Spinacia oleracea]|nr:hypothetical protein SOVF_060610 [Spinacia oleracea]
MGHNKGWEETASMFTGSVIELKTCNAALLEGTGKSWEEMILSFLLPFALVPLPKFTSGKAKMGVHANSFMAPG